MEAYFDQKGKTHPLPVGITPQNRTSCYGIIVQHQQLLLVQQHWDNRFGFPGGGIEKNENEHTALAREILEETGYQVQTIAPRPFFIKKTGFFALDLHQFFNSTLKYYQLTITDKLPQKIQDTNEIRQAKWIQIRKAHSKLSKLHQDALEAFTKSISTKTNSASVDRQV